MSTDETTATSERRLGAAIRDALDVALDADPRVFLLGEDIADPGGGVFRVTRGLSSKHGLERVRPTPISEQAIVGAAIGAALAGMRPVAEIMIMNFLAVCMDQLTNHAAKLRFMSGGRTPLPLTVRCSAGAGMQFGAQHSDMLEAWLCHVPGLKVVVPSTPADAKGLLLSCIFDDDPCVFVEQTLLYATKGPVPDGDVRVPLGQAVIRRTGTDVTIVSYGRQVGLALEAAGQLDDEGISTTVVDLRTLVPLDEEVVLSAVAATGRAVVVHEAVQRCGFGAELVAVIAEHAYHDLRAPVLRVGARPVPVPFAAELEAAYLPSVADAVAAVRRTLA